MPVLPCFKGVYERFNPGNHGEKRGILVGREPTLGPQPGISGSENSGVLHFLSRKERSSHSDIPCTKVLSVAGFCDISLMFPLWSGFILEVFPRRPEQHFLTFPEY